MVEAPPPPYTPLVHPPDGQLIADSYFSEDSDAFSSYKYDYEKIVRFQREILSWQCLAAMAACVFFLVQALLLNDLFIIEAVATLSVPTIFAFMWLNIGDAVRAQHVALTRDGIRFVVEKHPTGLRCSCFDKGKRSQTVPFDKVTDCDVSEPAGTALLCLVPNVLFTVRVDTANGPTLLLTGLADPYKFKSDVWAMKRGEGVEGAAESRIPIGIVRLDEPSAQKKGFSRFLPGRGKQAGSEEDVVPLLLERNALLAEAVRHLKVVADSK